MKKYPAVIKWSGSKRLVASQLAQQFPRFERYFEPFVGGGAMLPYSRHRKGFAGDIIPELICLWNEIKEHPSRVADEYERRWNDLQKRGADVYYIVREDFNRTRNCHDFLFLSRTCVNGLIRFNGNGDFNNSFHLSRPGINPETFRQQIYEWSKAVSLIEFKAQDYRSTLADACEGDFVFLDPPYGGTKGRYTKDEFVLNDFYLELESLNRRGVKWMLTFDGKAGERSYDYAPPQELYKVKFSVDTGNSAFVKVENKRIDKIEESVYLNYDSALSPANLFQ